MNLRKAKRSLFFQVWKAGSRVYSISHLFSQSLKTEVGVKEVRSDSAGRDSVRMALWKISQFPS